MPPARDFYEANRFWLRLALWLLTAVLGVFALRLLGPLLIWAIDLLSPFLVALVLAYIFDPVVTFVQRKLKLGRTGGIAVLALVVFPLLAGIFAWLSLVLYDQSITLVTRLKAALPGMFDRFMAEHVSGETLAVWKDRIEANLGQIDELAKQALARMGGSLSPIAEGSLQTAGNVAGGVLNALGQVGGMLGGTLLIVIVTFYYLTDMDKIPATIRRLLPEKNRERTWELMVKADRAVGGFLRGQLMACTCVAVLVTAILFAVGMKQYALLVGCFAGVMNFIPYLGPIAGATPAMLWALFSGQLETWNERGLTILTIVGGFALVQAVDSFVFQPTIVGKQANLHPLAVIFALAVGAQAGIGGMIVAVPLACIAKVLWVELYWRERTDFLAATGNGGVPSGGKMKSKEKSPRKET
jgi:predicted PurR-regulated permease PerM